MEATAAKWSRATEEAESDMQQIRGEHQIAAKRIKSGELVGDTWLFGRGAVELLKLNLVTEDDLRPYRSALYFSAKNVGGRDYADAIEANMLTRHERAVADFREVAANGR